MASFWASFFLIAIAEMGDKTQLMTLSFACKYNPYKVMAGVFVGTLAVHLVSVILGELIGFRIPVLYLNLLVAASFIGFGVWTLVGEKDEEAGEDRSRFGIVFMVAAAFFLGEMGDKTQLATISLAAEYRNFLGVWMGSTAGMVLANALAVVVGTVAHKHLPMKLIKYVSAVIFILVGVAMLVGVGR